MSGWAKGIVGVRARLGGVAVGAIAVDIRLVLSDAVGDSSFSQ